MYVAFLGSGMQVLPWNVPSRVFTGSGLRSPSAATVFLIRPLSALVGRGWRVLLLATSLLLELALGEGRGVSLNFSPYFPPFKKKWYLWEKLHLSGVYMPGAVCTRLVCTSNVFVIGSSGLKWKETCREQAVSDSLVAAQCCSFAEWTLAGNPLTAGFGDFFFPPRQFWAFSHLLLFNPWQVCVCVCVCVCVFVCWVRLDCSPLSDKFNCSFSFSCSPEALWMGSLSPLAFSWLQFSENKWQAEYNREELHSWWPSYHGKTALKTDILH